MIYVVSVLLCSADYVAARRSGETKPGLIDGESSSSGTCSTHLRADALAPLRAQGTPTAASREQFSPPSVITKPCPEQALGNNGQAGVFQSEAQGYWYDSSGI